MSKYAYSLDEERYYGQFDSIEEALAEVGQVAEDAALEESEYTRTVWIGEVTEAAEVLRKRNPLWIVDRIIEDADEYLNENIGWDDRIIEVTPERAKELGELLTDWLCKNATFNAYGITNVVEHTVKVSAA